ncbi:MAG: hypothetical protein ACI9HE_000275, partial [Planctomycetota bacterium]
DWLNNSHVSNLDLIGILTLEDGSELPYGLRPGGLAWLEVPGQGTLRLQSTYRAPADRKSPIPVRLRVFSSEHLPKLGR